MKRTTDKKRIEELERRVRELEQRPAIIVQPAPVTVQPVVIPPHVPQWPQYPYTYRERMPWESPFICTTTGSISTIS